jgi:hypothetical protein
MPNDGRPPVISHCVAHRLECMICTPGDMLRRAVSHYQCTDAADTIYCGACCKAPLRLRDQCALRKRSYSQLARPGLLMVVVVACPACGVCRSGRQVDTGKRQINRLSGSTPALRRGVVVVGLKVCAGSGRYQVRLNAHTCRTCHIIMRQDITMVGSDLSDCTACFCNQPGSACTGGQPCLLFLW